MCGCGLRGVHAAKAGGLPLLPLRAGARSAFGTRTVPGWDGGEAGRSVGRVPWFFVLYAVVAVLVGEGDLRARG